MIEFYILLAIGFAFLVLEIVSFSFYLFFIGVGFLLCGAISWVFYDILAIEIAWYWQILITMVFSVGLFFSFSCPLKRLFLGNKQLNDNFLDESGEGVIREGMVYFKGTFWRFRAENDEEFGENERVSVISTNGNEAKIAKIVK